MHFKLIFLFALISSTFAQLNYADNWFLSEESTNLTSLTEAIKDAEKFIVSLKDQLNLPSLVSGVSIRGKTVWNNVWGYADLENQVSAKLSTKYRMCSITKSFTSALIGTMVDRGLLHYGDPLSKYVSDSDYPAKSWDHQPVNITIGQLLSHTGGARFTETTDVDDFVEAKNCTQAVHKFRNVPLKFKPGTNYIYSNYGYILLGAVIESITKRPFPVELAQFIDQKLRLNSSYVEMPDLLIKDRARYYQALDATKHVKVNIPTTTYDQMLGEEGYWPAGSVLSTVADMLVYGNLMIDSFKGRPNAVLSKKTITDMWTPKTSHLKLNFNSEFEYAYGWVIRHINATQQPHVRHRYIVWHNGGLAGASTMLYIYPEEEMVAVAMTNKGNVQPALEQMLIRMVENIYDLIFDYFPVNNMMWHFKLIFILSILFVMFDSILMAKKTECRSNGQCAFKRKCTLNLYGWQPCFLGQVIHMSLLMVGLTQVGMFLFGPKSGQDRKEKLTHGQVMMQHSPQETTQPPIDESAFTGSQFTLLILLLFVIQVILLCNFIRRRRRNVTTKYGRHSYRVGGL